MYKKIHLLLFYLGVLKFNWAMSEKKKQIQSKFKLYK